MIYDRDEIGSDALQVATHEGTDQRLAAEQQQLGVLAGRSTHASNINKVAKHPRPEPLADLLG
jgi:hypothetical protein